MSWGLDSVSAIQRVALLLDASVDLVLPLMHGIRIYDIYGYMTHCILVYTGILYTVYWYTGIHM